jgi:hypothetical protein
VLTPQRRILALRAAAVLLLAFGVPALVGSLVKFATHPSIVTLHRGHPGAWLGLLENILGAAFDSIVRRYTPGLLAVAVGVLLIRASPMRLLRWAARWEIP